LFVQLILGCSSTFLGLLLLTVRPLIRLRSRVLPGLAILAGIILWIFQDAVFPVFGHYCDQLFREYCGALELTLFPAFTLFGVVYAIRNWQVLRESKG
jgi:hypothetical protein